MPMHPIKWRAETKDGKAHAWTLTPGGGLSSPYCLCRKANARWAPEHEGDGRCKACEAVINPPKVKPAKGKRSK